jgi:hypothetical protein
MNMTGGDVQVNNELWIGVGNKSLGTMNLSGGTVNVGGIINVAAGFRWNNADDEQFLTEGVLNLSGDAELRGATMLVGGRNVEGDEGTGNGVVNQTGGSLFLTAGLEIGVGPPGLPGGSESSGIYNLSGGLLDMGGSDISFGAGDGEFEFTGGVLRNVANVNFSLANGGGALEPGASAGVTNINGDYFVAASTAALNIEIGGLVQGAEYDLLNVTGTATLAGILNVTLIGDGQPVGDTNGDGIVNIDDLNNVRNLFGTNDPGGDTNGDGMVNIDDLNNVRNNFGVMGSGFAPADGDVFEILTAGAGRVGEFDTENLPGLSPGLAWNVNYLANSVELEVLATPGAVPEPSALLLVASGVALLSLARRRLRR